MSLPKIVCLDIKCIPMCVKKITSKLIGTSILQNFNMFIQMVVIITAKNLSLWLHHTSIIHNKVRMIKCKCKDREVKFKFTSCAFNMISSFVN